jgi:Leucine-rich repeat (LRR) protein
VGENPLDGLALGDFPNLIELRALDAGLSAITLGGLPSLRELHLRTNAFTAIPEVVRGLRELRVLDMRANRLTTVPDWIADLPRLEKLDLRWNEIRDEDAPASLRARGCVVLCE